MEASTHQQEAPVHAVLDHEVEPSADALTTLTRLAFGLAGMVVHLLGEVFRSLTSDEETGSPREIEPFAPALEALTLDAERRLVDLALTVGRWTVPAVAFVRALPPVSWSLARFRTFWDSLDAQGQAEAEQSRRLADEFVTALLRSVTIAVLERLDVDEVVRRVDMQKVLDRLDVDAIVARVDVQRVVAGLDLDAIVAGVDIQRVVAGLDLDAIVAQVDLNAVIERVDLPKVTEQVFDEVDLGQVIRESTGSISGETVDALRYQGMNLDRSLSRIVDRMLLRKRRADVATSPPEGDGQVVEPPP
jgi:hypothetical protein